MTTRKIELFMPASQDDSFIEQNMNMMFVNFLGANETASRFSIADGDQMKRVTISITVEPITHVEPASPAEQASGAAT